ncbi:MAG: AAA family ATPase, partial [Thermomicrobiales bacterium]
MLYRGERILPAAAAVFVVLYSMLVLGYVATSPDIGLRCLLIDEVPGDDGVHRGVVIKAVPPSDQKIFGEHPQKGDLLVRINESPIRTFMDFTRQVAALRSAPLRAGAGSYPIGFDPQELKGPEMLPSLVADVADHRFVEIEYFTAAAVENSTLNPDGTISVPAAEQKTCYLTVGSLPSGGVALTLLWFFLQLTIFAVSALVYWHRPNDRPSLLFFVMCIVTLGAFIGTSHWWIIAASFWLAAPCIICAMLLPAVALHFFLVFPKPWPILLKYPTASLVALYAIPVTATAGMLSLLGWCCWLNWRDYALVDVEQTRIALQWVRYGVYAYLMIASVYFVAAFAVLHQGLGAAQNFLEYSQLRLLWWAGLLGVFCMAWTLGLAMFRPTEFALGDWGARLAIFLAALFFTLAYTVGIVRYRMMLVDQIVSKGMLYYVFSTGLTVVISLAMVGSMLLPRYLNISLGNQQAIAITLVLMLVVAILLWLRDMFQRVIDRRFFREKYQLDKALQRMNRAVEHLVNPESLAEMMLSSCRDVLNVERAALYLRNSSDGPFHLVAALGAENIPIQFVPVPDFLETLHQAGSLQRVTPVSRSEMTPVQNVLRELR